MKFKFTKKRIIWSVIILVIVLIIGYLIFGRSSTNGSIQIAQVAMQNLQETVLATGQVVSGTDLSLAFQSGGIVKFVAVKEGDKIKKGMLLASLGQAQALATLTSAQGALLQAKANYEKLMQGATTEDIKTVQDSVDSANQNLNNYYTTALNVLNDSYLKIYNALAALITIQNSYFSQSDQEGLKVQASRDTISASAASAKSALDKATASINQNDIDSAILEMLSDLNKTSDALQIARDQADSGVYYSSVSAADKTILDTQKTNINTAITNTTTAQHNISSGKLALQQANDQLAFKKAPPRQSDIDASLAQVLSAQGQVDSAQASLNNLIIIAPADGTITSVDIKVGEQATAMKEVITLQNISDLHAEADVSEASIALMAVGQPIDYTFDALGPDQHFKGTILSINPASTVISGVVNYLVKGTLDNVPGIRPGMTANFTVLVAEKDNVLAVPSTAVINKNNGYYVRVIDDPVKKSYHEVQVQEGIQADGGLIEITSGLQEGQEIITYMK